MKTLLIGRTGGFGVRRLTEEFEKRGLVFSAISSRDVVMKVSDGTFALTDGNGVDLLAFDVFLFRGTALAFERELSAMAAELAHVGKIVVEGSRATGGVSMDKVLVPHSGAYAVPNYYLVFGRAALDKTVANLHFPIVVKSTQGSMGVKVRKVESAEELASVSGELGFPLIVQEFLPIRSDVRVLVVGDKVLGAFRRYNTPEDFLTTRRGTEKEVVALSEEMRELAVAAKEAQGIEIAGVDIAEREEGLSVFEVNSSPQFQAFENIVGVNVAGEIVDYLVEKFRRSQS